jgi:ADP-ribose pyrophosphatase
MLPEEIKRIDRKLEHKGTIISMYTDTMLLPDGHEVHWDFIEHKGAAAIMPVLPDGRIVMVRQYRNAIGRYTLEIPAGAKNPDEDPKTAAMRELEEETGYHTDDAKFLLDLYTTVAFCSERIGVFYTENLTRTQQHLDDDEYVNVELHTLPELVDMVLSGKIMDSKTIGAVLAYNQIKQGIVISG